ncbi:hypothetical protein F5879DRAFT_203640 [Lentinula edodes]|nr:hypothetical protein F5879DRAFT_203640 [Lentinula edodes]
MDSFVFLVFLRFPLSYTYRHYVSGIATCCCCTIEFGTEFISQLCGYMYIGLNEGSVESLTLRHCSPESQPKAHPRVSLPRPRIFESRNVPLPALFPSILLVRLVIPSIPVIPLSIDPPFKLPCSTSTFGNPPYCLGGIMIGSMYILSLV